MILKLRARVMHNQQWNCIAVRVYIYIYIQLEPTDFMINHSVIRYNLAYS